MKSPQTYSEEDWLVHTLYGIGQIAGIEVKSISGAKVQYFKVQTADSTFWLPVGQMDSEIIRPLSTPEEIQLVIALLHRPPKEMSADHNIRKSHVRRVQLQNTLEDSARLLRDLRAFQRSKGKYDLEGKNVIRLLKQRLVEEWAIVTDMKTEEVVATVEELLNHPQLLNER